MRRQSALQKKDRFTHAFHNAGGKRMQWKDAGYDVRFRRPGFGYAAQDQRQGKGNIQQ